MKNLFPFLQKHSTLMAVVSFAAGFGFSLWRERPIDTSVSLSFQALTLLLVFVIIVLEFRYKFGHWTPSSRLKNIWRFQELAIHFLLGGLLRGYAIFFLKSAGTTAPLIFFGVLLLLLLCNEIPFIQTKGPLIRTILWTLSFCCYLTFLIPVWLHRLGTEIFILSLICAFVAIAVGHFIIGSQVPSLIRRKFYFWPSLLTLLTYLALYQFAVIPPVPLMLTKFHVAHQVIKEKKDWLIVRQDSSSITEETLLYAPGQKIMAVFKVVAPRFFEEMLLLKWQVWEKNQWHETDVISISLTGGRKEGFRGSAEKLHVRPGQWRLLLTTLENREIGRLKFNLVETSEVFMGEARQEKL